MTTENDDIDQLLKKAELYKLKAEVKKIHLSMSWRNPEYYLKYILSGIIGALLVAAWISTYFAPILKKEKELNTINNKILEAEIAVQRDSLKNEIKHIEFERKQLEYKKHELELRYSDTIFSVRDTLKKTGKKLEIILDKLANELGLFNNNKFDRSSIDEIVNKINNLKNELSITKDKYNTLNDNNISAINELKNELDFVQNKYKVVNDNFSSALKEVDHYKSSYERIKNNKDILILAWKAVVDSLKPSSTEIKLFNNAISLYENNNNDSVIVLIKNYLKRNGNDNMTMIFVPIICEALYNTEEYVSVKRLIGMYQIRYPTSRFNSRLEELRFNISN